MLNDNVLLINGFVENIIYKLFLTRYISYMAVKYISDRSTQKYLTALDVLFHVYVNRIILCV